MIPEPLVVPFGYRLKPAYRNGLVGHWKMNVNGGNVLPDLSGNNNHGALMNFDWIAASGWGGNGLIFDGGDYLIMPDSANSVLNITGKELTISYWVRPTGLGVNFGGIAMKADNLGSKGYGCTYTSNKFNFFLYTNLTGYYSYATNGNYPLNIFYFIVNVYDGVSVKIYVNGILDLSSGHYGNIVGHNTKVFSIGDFILDGGTTPYANGYYVGVIYDVRIYNRALSADEVAHSYFQQEDEWDFGIDEILGGGTPIELLQRQVR